VPAGSFAGRDAIAAGTMTLLWSGDLIAELTVTFS
jgi:hypothetical protein